MKVTVHISSYASGNYQFCEHFPSLRAAKEKFAGYVNGKFAPMYLDGIGGDGTPDATMFVYPYTPEDSDYMTHGDYPMMVYSVGPKRHGRWTVREESV